MKPGKKNKGLSKKSIPGALNQILKQPQKKVIVKRNFKCKVCKKTFVRSDHLVSHSRLHTGERPYNCDVCGKSFRNCSNLKEHRRIHTGERPYECKLCGVGFLQSNHLKKHMRMHTEQKIRHECWICDKRFKTAEGLKKHMLDIHNLDEVDESPNKEIFQCHFCPQVFKNLHHFNEHNKNHSEGGCSRCEICRNGFTKVSDLNVQKVSQNKLPIQKFQCHICAEYFEKFCCLKVHLQTHIGRKPKFYCEICGKFFTRKTNLNKHYVVHKSSNTSDALSMLSVPTGKELANIKNEELDIKKENSLEEYEIDDEDEVANVFEERAPIRQNIFLCEYCNQSFTRERIWIKHIERHTGIPGKKNRKIPNVINASVVETRITRSCSSQSPDEIGQASKCEITVEVDVASTIQSQEEISNISESKIMEGFYSTVQVQEEISNASKSKIEEESGVFFASRTKEIGNATKIENGSTSKFQVKKPQIRTDWKCYVCELSFRVKYRFLSHMKVHTESYPDHSCKVCGKHYKNLQSFNKHRATHLKKGRKPQVKTLFD